jgi:uncharacterized circularly permuted ATP-grasp superfamily protein
MMTRPEAAVEYYNDLLVRRHLASTQEILERATREKGLAFGARPVCTVLRPLFVDDTIYEFVQRASTLVMRGISTLGKRLFEDGALRRELDLSSEEEEIIQIEHGYGAPDVSARLDGFMSPKGEFNFVEYNAESPGGLAYGDELSKVFSSMPIMEDFGKRYNYRAMRIRTFVFDELVAAYHRWGGKGLPNIAIVDWRGVSTYSEFLLLQNHFEARGCRVRIADPEDLEYRDGRLFIDNFPIDLVYKRILIGELLAKYGLEHPLIDAVRDRVVCIANGFRVQMLYKKSLFALLSDPANAHLFDPAVAQALSRHIPWTRKVRETNTLYRDKTIDLIPFIADNREQLVLKPNGEYGGKGVALGWECTDDEWKEIIKTALASSYIVQERVPLGRESFPSLIDGELRFDERFLDLDPYVWNGTRVEGCGVRLSKLALLNVTAGGGSATPMIVVSDK